MNELVRVQPQPPVMTFGELERVASAIAGSNMFGCRDVNAVLTLCLLAQAEGQHPAVVFRDYSIIQGKPSKTAEAMLRDFISGGGKVTWNRLDDECAEAIFSHPQGGEITINWTMARAVKAGLGSKDMWKKYPRQMLRSRVVSEGVRTICPSATSGLYVPEEVREFDDVKEPAHDSTTGEIIEGETIEQGDVRDPKIPGITKIRNNLNKLRRDGNKATDLGAFNALVHANADDLQKVKEEKHSLWSGMGEDFDGMKEWIRRRREELTPKEDSTEYQFLASCVNESTTTDELQKFMWAHGDKISDLDGEESRRFETLYDQRAAQLKELTPLTAGQFGG